MPTPSKGPRLGGSPSHERHMLANLASQLFQNHRITTTEHRAKRLRPYAEKLITLAKRGDTHARRLVLKDITDRGVVAELFEETAPKFAERNGGYTRITRVGNRKGDNAPMAVIALVLEPVSPKQAVRREADQVTRAAAPAPEPATEEAAEVLEELVAEAPAEAVEAPAEQSAGEITEARAEESTGEITGEPAEESTGEVSEEASERK